MNPHTIESLDVDGAVREAAERVEGDTRGRFMVRAALGAGGLMGGGALLATLTGAASAASKSDIAILEFALTLEYLEAAFYADAIAKGAVGTGAEREFATTAGSHEKTHVAALRKALGSGAPSAPTFDFGDATSSSANFVKTAILLEDTGVRAYKGQAPNIDSPAVLKAALSIHSVEANHASWIRFIAGENPTYTGAFEKPLTKSQVLKAVAKTGFIKS